MNRAIEFHDSTLACITDRDGDTVLHLDKAYIHESIGKPGFDDGTGWAQCIDLVLSNAVPEKMPAELPADISEGYVVTNGEKHNNLIKIPIDISGDIYIWFLTVKNEVACFKAKRIRSVEVGYSFYIEEYKA